MSSLLDSLLQLDDATRTVELAKLSDEEAAALLYDWAFWARPDQVEPAGEWTYWLLLAGRGFGKTRVGAETVRRWARDWEFVNLIGATADDARDIMIEGESGILAVCPPWERPTYRPSKRQLEWPNGARSLIFTADEPERLRGKQHVRLWADELGAWRYPEAWDQAMFGMRLGTPRAVVTTTPKPTRLIRDLVKNPACHVTRGDTYQNRQNLAREFFAEVIRKYEGTRIGRQELNGELLEDVEGALWTLALLDRCRVADPPGDVVRLVVAVDPNVTASEAANDAGIVVACVDETNRHGWVLADLTVGGGPEKWGRVAVNAYHRFEADRLVAETNQGGDLVRHLIHTIDKSVAYKSVNASRGKRARAEPVAALYEQGRVHHVGSFPELEDEMTTWTPGPGAESPNRMDALVWALTDLMVGPGEMRVFDRRAYSEPVVKRGDLTLRGERYVDKDRR